MAGTGRTIDFSFCIFSQYFFTECRQGSMKIASKDKIPRDVALLVQLSDKAALNDRPSLGAVAGQLSISLRTLKRSLWHRGLRFRDLLGYARCETAKQLLVDTDRPVQEISGIRDMAPQQGFRLRAGVGPTVRRASSVSANGKIRS